MALRGLAISGNSISATSTGRASRLRLHGKSRRGVFICLCRKTVVVIFGGRGLALRGLYRGLARPVVASIAVFLRVQAPFTPFRFHRPRSAGIVSSKSFPRGGFVRPADRRTCVSAFAGFDMARGGGGTGSDWGRAAPRFPRDTTAIYAKVGCRYAGDRWAQALAGVSQH